MNPRTLYAFKEKGVLSDSEFVIAVDNLISKCPTWSWHYSHFSQNPTFGRRGNRARGSPICLLISNISSRGMDLSTEAAENLQEYFRTMYKKVTEADIEEFEANYSGSDSEKKDLKNLYTEIKGNMNM
ncbi:uncharacterized protein LOC109828781 isoform X2 [Asparagus officinalis]|uniref:uncharacterized protein LOC109828781 isoform X2 n=1 Tax=Asparagus officinalis TaxID=4686 RepID=UPI00098E0C15|nr:uncharacterized protein LOC109828781 isoform X2 [Asparagus officinalis]